MTDIFIAAIRKLEVFGDLGAGDKVHDKFKVTNNREFIRGLLPQSAIPLIGTLEEKVLLSGCLVIYAKTDSKDGVSPAQKLIDCLHEAERFLATFWIVQDNAAVVENGFLARRRSDGYIEVFSNFVGGQYFSCDGKSESIKLTREQLREVRLLSIQILEKPSEMTSSQHSYITESVTDITRTLYFITQARRTNDLALKVTHYCTAFETLFATSQVELSHQLAERISSFLHTDLDSRVALFKLIKEAYGVRSKVVHGDTLGKAKFADLPRISDFCDSTARQVLSRYWTDPMAHALFQLPKDKFDDEMIRSIMGGQTSIDGPNLKLPLA
jgi:hypothetical protein